MFSLSQYAETISVMASTRPGSSQGVSMNDERVCVATVRLPCETEEACCFSLFCKLHTHPAMIGRRHNLIAFTSRRTCHCAFDQSTSTEKKDADRHYGNSEGENINPQKNISDNQCQDLSQSHDPKSRKKKEEKNIITVDCISESKRTYIVVYLGGYSYYNKRKKRPQKAKKAERASEKRSTQAKRFTQNPFFPSMP